MIRFIIKRHEQDHNEGTNWIDYYTIDCEVEALEEALTDGGFGPMGFERHTLQGVEILPPDDSEADDD